MVKNWRNMLWRQKCASSIGEGILIKTRSANLQWCGVEDTQGKGSKTLSNQDKRYPV